MNHQSAVGHQALALVARLYEIEREFGGWVGFYNHQRSPQALNMKTPAEAYA